MELPVALVVLPLFAFLNAGVPVNASAMAALTRDPVALGIVAGLLIGKPLGVFAGIRLAEGLGLACRQPGLTGRHLLGVGLLAGIGFTMSTFIANLALGDDAATIDLTKLAIVLASVVAGVTGYCVLRTAPGRD